MPKGFWFVIATFVLLLILVIWGASVEIVEFKTECRSHGGTPVISRDTSICYAPGTVIKVGS